MPQGPVLIFDKSALQMLSLDEAVWLDNFYQSNITPLFFVETLADLEKELAEGRSAEQYVGALAHKTPDMQSVSNIHHRQLVHGELLGLGTVPLDGLGRPVLGHGRAVRQGDGIGMLFEPTPEEEALLRWQNGKFEEIERLNAKAWREEIKNLHPKDTATRLSQFVSRYVVMPKTFTACKDLADEMLRTWNREVMLMLGLALTGVQEPHATIVTNRWKAVGRPPLRSFAPYFSYVCSVDLTFFLATAAGLVRDADRSSNKVDIAYLYYLPFCTVFTSNDRLHKNLAPLFLHSMQNFILGDEMRADLGRLNTHYSALPEETRLKGLMDFAGEPPDDQSFLTTRMWDKYHPNWRTLRHQKNALLSEEENSALVNEINSWAENGEPVEANVHVTTEDCEVVTRSSKVLLRKGSWRRFSPEVEAAAIADN